MQVPHGDELLRGFTQDLRKLMDNQALTFRALAAKTHYSRTAMSTAVGGRTLPSLAVTLAFVAACGGDRDEWEQRWRALRLRLHGSSPAKAAAPPAWPIQPVADHSEPESAGSAADAVTAHARRIALDGRKHIIGQVEVRYSAATRAAWARFEGFGNLDHLAAHRHDVEIEVEIQRLADRERVVYREEYTFDFHWTNLLRTGGERFVASVAVYFDGKMVAYGRTDPILLA